MTFKEYDTIGEQKIIVKKIDYLTSHFLTVIKNNFSTWITKEALNKTFIYVKGKESVAFPKSKYN